jgi:putative intracellular protease/amidase
MVQFLGFRSAQHALANTIQLATIKADQFGAVFYPGGHGPLWDLANDEDSIALIQKMITTEKAVALVCHVPGVLKDVMLDGAPLVKGRQVTGFSNTCVFR